MTLIEMKILNNLAITVRYKSCFNGFYTMLGVVIIILLAKYM